jgi:hypothetical protein
LDESGRSRHEPKLVVGGIIVHGDRFYRKLEQRIHEIIGDFIPAEDRKGFVFHAKDLFQGAGYFKDKDKWPREKRFPILRALAATPKEFWTPVVFGYLDKSENRDDTQQRAAVLKERDRAHAMDIVEHMVAFSRAEMAIEYQMHRFPRDEVCMLVAEDTDRIKRAVKQAHAFLRDPAAVANSQFAGTPYLPLSKIVDTPNFAAKTDSVLLQIADMCAYLILRRFLRRSDSQEFFELIAPQITLISHEFGEPMGAEALATGSVV